MRQVLACMGSLRLDPQLGSALLGHGVNLSLAGTDRECIHQLREFLPEAVLLGIPLDPLQTACKCAAFRRETGAALLAVSSSYSQRQAVAALEAGADDYLVLKENYEELGARLRALLRRSARVSEQRDFDLGDLRIDAESRTVRVRDRGARLTPLEFRLLSCLAANPGKSLSPGTLLRAVQGYDLNEQDASHIIKALVWRLRQKIELDPAHPVYVHNVRGSGYILERRDTTQRTTAEAQQLLEVS